mmetsp:Transcript_31862/g.62726  ORF Transcript_31862/g.62726 Transcript_31862/m.62726 type:complete len:207 (-) Transcript_31862:152-772(-)
MSCQLTASTGKELDAFTGEIRACCSRSLSASWSMPLLVVSFPLLFSKASVQRRSSPGCRRNSSGRQSAGPLCSSSNLRGSAEYVINSTAMRSSPLSAAKCSGRMRSSSRAFTCALAFSSSCTQLKDPLFAANMSGVMPLCLLAFCLFFVNGLPPATIFMGCRVSTKAPALRASNTTVGSPSLAPASNRTSTYFLSTRSSWPQITSS